MSRRRTGAGMVLNPDNAVTYWVVVVLLVGAVVADGVLAAMKADPNVRASFCTPVQARKVAWRITKDWVEAQIAIVEAQLATLDQVMLPHLMVEGQRTLYAVYKDREQAAITAGGDT